MEEHNYKVLSNYDFKRLLQRIKKDYGEIERGNEEHYNPQLDYIEKRIDLIYNKISISEYELQEVLLACIFDLKGYVDNTIYDYQNLLNSKQLTFVKELEKLFNPFLNADIKINETGINDLKGLFTLPIICLARIHLSIDFWHQYYGTDGYFKMLKENSVVMSIGDYPYALDFKYLEGGTLSLFDIGNNICH